MVKHFLAGTVVYSVVWLTLVILVKVVGMGDNQQIRSRFDFSLKFAEYSRQMKRQLSLGGYSLNDVIVLMDAFDVVVFPAIRDIKQVIKSCGELYSKCYSADMITLQVLETSGTPIVACAENGMHIGKSSMNSLVIKELHV